MKKLTAIKVGALIILFLFPLAVINPEMETQSVSSQYLKLLLMEFIGFMVIFFGLIFTFFLHEQLKSNKDEN